MNPAARVIADSISNDEHRVTTLEVTFHRWVLAEFNTHRMFSRNSASSRAIPLRKQLDRVVTEPALPAVWATEQKGMQGGEPLSPAAVGSAESEWLAARQDAVNHAVELGELGVHKSIVNRLLEPFLMHTAVVTATEWDNFWEQRCSPLAQPEIRVAAEAMKAAYDASVPRLIKEGDWHAPYLDKEDVDIIVDRTLAGELPPSMTARDVAARVSAARCARVSYLTQDGRRDINEDLVLYDRLVSASPMHASPLEHVCTPRNTNTERVTVRTTEGLVYQIDRPRYGNLYGWHQLRYDVQEV